MPRLVTPSANPYAHASHTLGASRNRLQRSTMSPSNSDKENASPPQEHEPMERIFASQAALREKLSEKSNTQYYDPHLSREKQRETNAKYRNLLRETNGISNQGLWLM